MSGTLYSPTTWIEANTKVGPTNLNKIEQALADSTRLFSGLYSAIPAASASYLNKFYYATDKLALFGCFDGATWTQLTGIPVTITTPATGFGTHYVNYNSSFRYWKDPDGYVHCMGEINDDGTALAAVAANSIIWDGFPAGFRPPMRMYFEVETNVSGQTNHLLFNTSGQIRVSDNYGANPGRYMNLGHITFPTF
jgi:hypothetical protein